MSQKILVRMAKIMMPKFRRHMNSKNGIKTRQKKDINDVNTIFNGAWKKDSLRSAILGKKKMIMELKKKHYYE
jgi:hypothetical protein